MTVAGQPRVRSGTRWVAVANLTKQFLNWGTLVLLARLLSPTDFGLLSMALVFAGLTAVVRDFGIGAATVQATRMSRRGLSTVHWLAIAVGVGAAIALISSAPGIARLYSEPRLLLMTRVLAVNFVAMGAMAVPFSLLDRRLDFRRSAVLEVAGAALGSVCAVTCAFLGLGVWSLVAQLTAQAVATSILAQMFVRWRPALVFDRSQIRGIGRYSAYLTAFQGANYFSRNADYFLIGLTIGSSDLGIYTVAYRLAFQLVQTLSSITVRVLFPLLSRLQDDLQTLRDAYRRATCVAAAVALPFLVVLWAYPTVIVRILLGKEWLDTVPLIRLFAPTAALQVVATMVGTIYQSIGRTDAMFLWGLCASAITVLGFVIGVQWGIVGVGTAYLITTMVLFIPGLWIPLRMVGMRVRDLMRDVGSIAASGSLSLVTMLAVGAFLGDSKLAAATSAVVGVGIYAATLARISPTIVRDVRSLAAARRLPVRP